jgi:flavin-dependent dehydrogenase
MASCEVLVIGGGPAGATLAALAARRGRDVVLLEKDRHPRFHIGESLLPHNLPLFERLGVARDIERIAMPKYGAELVSPWHGAATRLEFADAWDKSAPLAYQVRRSEFDEILFRHAQKSGARALEGWRATAVALHAAGATVTARADDGAQARWDARFLVDASGRDTFLAAKLGLKQRSRRHNSAALFAHFAGATRLPGKAEGHISIFWFDHGWFWFIPLADGATSIGAVCAPHYLKSRRGSPEQFLMDSIALCPALAERLRGARLVSPVTGTGNYSYSAARSSGERYLLLGDAYAFIDPVFSTGVYLAMQSAFIGADTIERCLARPAEARAALRAFDASMRHGPRVFSWFIYRVTTPGLRDILMSTANPWRVREALLSVLAGDVFRRTPYGLRLLALKALYYLLCLGSPRASWRAWRRRRHALQAA